MDLEPLDPVYVQERLKRPPFVTIPGVVNVRDLGSYPTDQPGTVTKPGLLYRAGELSSITDEGKQPKLIYLVFLQSADAVVLSLYREG